LSAGGDCAAPRQGWKPARAETLLRLRALARQPGPQGTPKPRRRLKKGNPRQTHGHSDRLARLAYRGFRGNIPSFIHISDGKLHDVHALDLLLPEAGAIYVMDRGYVDFARLHVLHQAGAFFVTRAKSNLDAHRVYSAPTDRAAGIIADQTIALDGYATSKDYPVHLRRVRFKDPESGKTLVFLTNQFALPAASICAIYKSRWQVELFFKWIKQHLRIKQFYGTSDNAVKTQIWIAVSVYVLVAIVKKRLGLEASLYTLMQIFSVTLFEKMPMLHALSQTRTTFEENEIDSQLNLFSF
jgi:transposase